MANHTRSVRSALLELWISAVLLTIMMGRSVLHAGDVPWLKDVTTAPTIEIAKEESVGRLDSLVIAVGRSCKPRCLHGGFMVSQCVWDC